MTEADIRNIGYRAKPVRRTSIFIMCLDLWADRWRSRHADGDVIIVKFCDDFVVGFQHRKDAQRFLDDFEERFLKFNLKLHQDKTRLIEFGRFAARNHKSHGKGKPETFDFLGFTHI